MDDTTALTAITQKLTTDTGALIASIPAGGTPPPSVQPAIDAATAALTALDGKVLAATPAPATAAPQVTGVAPASLVAGVQTPVVLTGTGFTGATAINGTPALSFDSVAVVSDTQITVNVTVAAGTAPGAQQLSVTGPAGTSNAAPLQTT